MDLSTLNMLDKYEKWSTQQGVIILRKTLDHVYNVQGEKFVTTFFTYAVTEILRLAALWDVKLGEALHGGVQSLCVQGVTVDGKKVVIKVPSDITQGTLEQLALTQWVGFTEAEILVVDPEGKGYLMVFIENTSREQIFPEMVSMLTRLHSTTTAHGTKLDEIFPPVENFTTLKVSLTEDRLKDTKSVKHHTRNLGLAKNIINYLHTSPHEKTLLHGDTKNHNILTTLNGLTIIDPQPGFGDKLFDLALWVAGSAHTKPIQKVYADYSIHTANNPYFNTNYERFLLWVWVLAVIENRPHVKEYATERQTYIDTHYENTHALFKNVM